MLWLAVRCQRWQHPAHRVLLLVLAMLLLVLSLRLL